MNSPRAGPIVAGVLVLAAVGYFVAQGVRLIDHYSPTFDEGAHLVAGYSYWKTRDFRINPEHPPLAKLLFALPLVLTEPELRALDGKLLNKGNHWEVSRWFFANSPAPIDRLFYKARLVNLAIGAVLLLLIAWWTFRLWGPAGAVFAAWLAALDPSLQAHSCLLTMDVALTLFSTLTFYTLWEFGRFPTPPRLVAVGVALGLALATKFTAIFILILLAGVIGLHLLAGGTFRMPGGEPTSPTTLKERVRLAVPPLLRVGLVAALVLVVVYFVVGFPAWGQGFKEQLVRAGRVNITYLNGEVTPHGRTLYYPLVVALKTPVGTLLAFALALLPFLGAHMKGNEARLLLFPALGYFGLMVYSGVDLGVRLLLPSYALLYILFGRLLDPPPGPRVLSLLLVLLPLGLTIKSAGRDIPYKLAYFNEFAGGWEDGHRYLADSNLDWGQDLKELKAEMDRRGIPIVYLSYYGTMEPEWYGIRHQHLPAFGRTTPPPPDRVPADGPKFLAISVNNLLGLYLDEPSTYHWLRDRTPAFRAGASILVYDLTGDADALRRVEALSP